MSDQPTTAPGGARPCLGKDDPVCARCGEGGTSCCRTDPATAHLSFPLSEAEWQRLIPYAHLAVPDADCADGEPGRAAEGNHPDFVRAMLRLFPGQSRRIRELFPADGVHYRLRTTAAGSCVFLGAQGCRLPREVRPWYCLLFPAWVARGEVTMFTAAECLIARQAKNPLHGLSLYGMHPDAVRELHTRLAQDWGIVP